MLYEGGRPTHNEPEVVLFGPGYGEAIAVHLGEDKWLLVDSCLDPRTREPAPLTYLRDIGVNFSNVVAIVASHWHDDHCKGLADIVRACANAELFISAAYSDTEAQEFLAAYSGKESNGLSAGTTELYNAVSSANSVFSTSQRTEILDARIGTRSVAVRAFSPTQAALAQALQHFAAYAPVKKGEPINHVPVLKPNLEAVVLHIDLGDESILLGADLEHHGELGWSEIVTTAWCTSKRKATIYKVAHHGSSTAEHEGIWQNLLEDKPTTILTPFVRGKVKLPTNDDIQRITDRSRVSYISSNASKRARLERTVLKQLSKLGQIQARNPGFGAIQLRRKDGVWNETLFGDARQMAA